MAVALGNMSHEIGPNKQVCWFAKLISFSICPAFYYGRL